MAKIRVLFVCVHNSGRSQMAEAFLERLGGDRYDAESAGLDPQRILPLVVDVMKEVGIDLSGKESRSVFSLFREGRLYDHVITVCDERTESLCPLFPGIQKRLHWPFEDPSTLEGSAEEKREACRRIRDAIRLRLEAWLREQD